jgi:hypothetical protein
MGLSISTLFSSLASLVRWGKDKDVRILMLGLDSAGKVWFVLLVTLLYDNNLLSDYDTVSASGRRHGS